MELDKDYRIVYEENNVTLQYHEIKIRTKKNGEKENYEFVDNFYYPNLQSALKAYSNKALSYSKSIKDVLDRQYNIELLIKQLN
jgi:hypothetical protein